MPRVLRSYQHQDLSYLIIQPQKPEKPMPKHQSISSVVTPEKRRRDSLMSNRKLRYVLSDNGTIHDRDCPHVAQIPDEAFSMCENFPSNQDFCSACYRTALIRKGLDPDLSKYLDAALWFFGKTSVSKADLETLFIEHNARIYRMEVGRIFLKIHEDCWFLEISNNYTCWLYHNNYCLLNNGQRIMEAGFHLQVDKPIPFHNAMVTMCRYTWIGHVQITATEGRDQRQSEMRQRLATVPGYRLTPKHSLLFRYFQIAVPSDYPEALPFRILKKGSYDSCYLLLCRTPFWNKKRIAAIADSVRDYCIEHEQLCYEQLCLRIFSME